MKAIEKVDWRLSTSDYTWIFVSVHALADGVELLSLNLGFLLFVSRRMPYSK